MADVVVIGAGIAGLVAVYHILKEKPDAKVILLEAAEHAGGQIRSLQLQGASGTDTWDIGASFIQRSQKCLMSLLSEFKLETLPPSKGKRILQLGDGTIKSYSGSIPPLPWSSLLDLHRYMSKLEGSSKKLNMTNPCEGAKAIEQDNTSVEELKVKTLWTQSAKDMADTLAGSVLSVNPKNISVLYYEYILHANKGWEGLLGSSKDGLHRIKGGAGKLVSALVEAIGETNIVFKSKVMSIKHTHEGGEGLVTVEVITGETYSAKKVIVTQGRGGMLGSSSFHLWPVPRAPLPCTTVAVTQTQGKKSDTIEFLPSAPVVPPLLPITYGISFVMTFSKSFWQDTGYCGEVLSMSGTIQYLTGDGEWFATAIFDATTAIGNPALSGILNPLSLKDKTVEERKSEILKLLAKYFKMENAEVLDYADHTWGEPWKYGDELLTASSLADRRKPFHSIHWADRHTAMEWYNTIEGAIQVGLRAAKEVLNCI